MMFGLVNGAGFRGEFGSYFYLFLIQITSKSVIYIHSKDNLHFLCLSLFSQTADKMKNLLITQVGQPGIRLGSLTPGECLLAFSPAFLKN